MADAGFTYVPLRSARRKRRPGAAAAAAAAAAAEPADAAAAAAAQLARRRAIVLGKRRLLDEAPLGEALRACLRTHLGLAAPSDEAGGGDVEALAAQLGALRTQPAASTMPAALLPAPTTTTTTTPPPTPPRRILHLGLGRVADARVPQVQLALLLVVRDLLGGETCVVEGYDPVWTEQDAALLRSYETQILVENKRASHTLDEPTLVYMPHCGRALYEALLRANWSARGLERLVLLCNAFARYADLAIKLEHESPCLSRILPHLHAEPLPSLPPPHHDALNDVCLQRFAPRAPDGARIEPSALPASFWQLPPPPPASEDEGRKGDEEVQ